MAVLQASTRAPQDGERLEVFCQDPDHRDDPRQYGLRNPQDHTTVVRVESGTFVGFIWHIQTCETPAYGIIIHGDDGIAVRSGSRDYPLKSLLGRAHVQIGF